MYYIRNDCTKEHMLRPWKSDEKEMGFSGKVLEAVWLHRETRNEKECTDQSRSPADAFMILINKEPWVASASTFSNF